MKECNKKWTNQDNRNDKEKNEEICDGMIIIARYFSSYALIDEYLMFSSWRNRFTDWEYTQITVLDMCLIEPPPN